MSCSEAEQLIYHPDMGTAAPIPAFPCFLFGFHRFLFPGLLLIRFPYFGLAVIDQLQVQEPGKFRLEQGSQKTAAEAVHFLRPFHSKGCKGDEDLILHIVPAGEMKNNGILENIQIQFFHCFAPDEHLSLERKSAPYIVQDAEDFLSGFQGAVVQIAAAPFLFFKLVLRKPYFLFDALHGFVFLSQHGVHAVHQHVIILT